MEVVRGLGVGGAERSLAQRLAFAPPGIATLVIDTRPVTAPRPEVLVPPGIPCVAIAKGPNRRDFGWLGAALDFQPDALVIRTPTNLVQLHASRRRIGTLPVVFEAHSERASGRPELEFAMRYALLTANTRASLHIAASSRVAQGPQCWRANRCDVHYFGSHLAATSPSQLLPSRGLRFLVVGRLVRSKRVPWLLEIVSRLREEFRSSGSELIVAGAGPELHRVVNLVERNRLSDIVSVLGHVSEPEQLFWSSDVLLVPSRVEGLPLTVFEAKLAGMTVVSTPAGGVSEVLGEEDRVLPNFSVESMSFALRAQLERPPLTAEVRAERATQYAWLDASARSPAYYELLASVC